MWTHLLCMLNIIGIVCHTMYAHCDQKHKGSAEHHRYDVLFVTMYAHTKSTKEYASSYECVLELQEKEVCTYFS